MLRFDRKVGRNEAAAAEQGSFSISLPFGRSGGRLGETVLGRLFGWKGLRPPWWS